MYENNYENYENSYVPQAPAPKKKSGAAKIVAVALCCSLFGGAVGAAGTFALTKLSPEDTAASTILESSRDTQSPTLGVRYVEPGKELSASEVYNQNVNSTVGITTSINTNYFGYHTTAAASGSGFIITENGYIVTNYHVIEGASSVTVSTYSGESYPAEIVGYDEENDIAVIKIDASGLTPVTLGSSDGSSVGDYVCAIGNPLGELTFSLTQGVISALDRSVTVDGRSMNLIQTDCAINAGNSGGPLFNMYGEVIGITNAKLSSSSLSEASIDNIAFAIPIDDVKSMITSIISDGTVEKPYIGVSISTLGSEYQRFGMSGVVVQGVDEGSPADEAGLQQNDIITAINGKTVTETSELIGEVQRCSDGEKVTLSVTRQGKEITVDVTVKIKKQSALANGSDNDDDKNANGSGNGGNNSDNGGNGNNSNGNSNGNDNSNNNETFPFGNGFSTFPWSDLFPWAGSEM